MQCAESRHLDPGILAFDVKWDIPLLEGYPWELVPNRSVAAKLDSFLGPFNPGIWRLISRGNFDAVVLYTGYMCATFFGLRWRPQGGNAFPSSLAPTRMSSRLATATKRWKLLERRNGSGLACSGSLAYCADRFERWRCIDALLVNSRRADRARAILRGQRMV